MHVFSIINARRAVRGVSISLKALDEQNFAIWCSALLEYLLREGRSVLDCCHILSNKVEQNLLSLQVRHIIDLCSQFQYCSKYGTSF